MTTILIKKIENPSLYAGLFKSLAPFNRQINAAAPMRIAMIRNVRKIMLIV